MTDLIEELRTVAKRYTAGISPDAIGGKPEHYIQWKAADEIEKLRQEIDLLRAGIADDGLSRVALQTVARTLQNPAVPTPAVIEWAQKVIRERSRYEQSTNPKGE